MHNGNWDDLRYLLAVARFGGVAAAARELKVNHSTVLRHVSAYEARHGVQLFDRRASGYALTEHGRLVLGALESVEGAIAEVERKVAGHGGRLEGTLTVTTTDSIAVHVVGPHLGAFHARFPNIVVDLRGTNQALNIAHRDADVAIRPSHNPPEELVGVPVGPLAFAVYGATEYVAQHGKRPLVEQPWLGLGELLERSPPAVWMRTAMGDAEIKLRADSFLSLQAGAEQGIGVAILPCFLGDASSALARLTEPLADVETTLWLLTHPDLRKSGLVRAFLDYFAQALRAQLPLLAGAH